MTDNTPYIVIADDTPLYLELHAKLVQKICKEKGVESEIILCKDGEEALSTIEDLRQQGEHILFVLTDMQMPYMNGAELAMSIYAQFPEIPMVIATSAPELVPRENLSEDVSIFEKITDDEKIKRKIVEILETED